MTQLHPIPVRELPDVMSIDLEDYFHVEAFADRISRADWPLFPSRVRRNTEAVLELLAAHGCKATFFVLGWVAERYPELIRNVAAAGHEIACHSYAHRRVNTLTPSEFRTDLRRACGAIEDACGKRPVGYRAPTFSIVKSSLWALEILTEEGFLYDSSIFPVRHDLYGFPDAPRWGHTVEFNGGSIFEVPMSTVRLGGTNFPVGGGGYLRLLPMWYTRRAIRRIHEKEKKPVIVYFHPWEIDHDQPRLPGSWKSRFRHYTGLGRMKERLSSLLREGRFTTMIELVRMSHPLKQETVREVASVS